MSSEKRKINYHPDVDFNKDSVILREALIRSLENIQKAARPSEEVAKALENFKKASQPPQAILKAIKNIQTAIKPSHKFLTALTDAEKLKKIVEEYEEKK